MGVTLEVENLFFSLSYSFLHVIRLEFVDAAIRYLTHLHDPDALPLLQLLRSILSHDQINYATLINPGIYHTITESLSKFDLFGLYGFINHSDHSGFLTCGQATDLKRFIELIYPHLDSRHAAYEEGNEHCLENHIIYQLCVKSIYTGKPIQFC
jgi:hypothetical protein